MKTSDPAWLRKIFVRAAVLPVLVITVLAALLGWQMSELLSTTRLVEHTDRIIAQATVTQTLLVDLETGLRGYQLTGDDDFLEPYRVAQNKLPRALERLEGLVGPGAQLARVKQLEQQLSEWIAYSHDVLVIHNRNGDDHSSQFNQPGKKMMDGMRTSVAVIVREENLARLHGSRAAESSTWTVVGLGGMLTVLAGVLLAALTTHHLSQVAKSYDELLATRAAAEAELEKRARALEEADRQKDEFLAMLAHELRNPLAAISNAVQVIKSGRGEQVSLPRLREIMERQCGHLARLVDDLLDVSRITRERIDLHPQAVDVAAAMLGAESTVQSLMLSRAHQLTLTPPQAPLCVEADPVRLEQILVNLLTNAAKYTPPGGRIWCEASEELRGGERWAMLRVRDNGVGIAPEFLPHIFDLFAQADRSLDRRDGGLGIGLTLVRRLAALHHGTIEARSDGPGKGSEFILRLPACVGTPAPAATSLAPETMPRELPTRVLLVEDNFDAAETMTELLELWGHEVTLARDGRAAVNMAEREQPEVMLLDIGLPLLSGYEVAEQVRADMKPETQPVIIALSGYGQPEDQERGVQAGFDYHLVKPVDADRLQALLAQVTSERPPRRAPQNA